MLDHLTKESERFERVDNKYYLARDSGFRIPDSRLRNKSMKMYFKKIVPDFRISKYVFTIVLL